MSATTAPLDLNLDRDGAAPRVVEAGVGCCRRRERPPVCCARLEVARRPDRSSAVAVWGSRHRSSTTVAPARTSRFTGRRRAFIPTLSPATGDPLAPAVRAAHHRAAHHARSIMPRSVRAGETEAAEVEAAGRAEDRQDVGAARQERRAASAPRIRADAPRPPAAVVLSGRSAAGSHLRMALHRRRQPRHPPMPRTRSTMRTTTRTNSDHQSQATAPPSPPP
jgi:hypothetical protein